jgi:4-carboxymuconolactone decarboxylase
MTDDERRERGERAFAAVYGGVVELPPPAERDAFLETMLGQLFAEVWSRDVLSVRDRRLLIMGAIAALGERELFGIQARAALAKNELTREQLDEAVLTLVQYVGYPRASGLRAVVKTLVP